MFSIDASSGGKSSPPLDDENDVEQKPRGVQKEARVVEPTLLIGETTPHFFFIFKSPSSGERRTSSAARVFAQVSEVPFLQQPGRGGEKCRDGLPSRHGGHSCRARRTYRSLWRARARAVLRCRC
ncbi:unnamed protein product [Lampetra fluviatilis]